MTIDFFDDDRYWLEKQPGMRPWKQGCLNLAATFQQHIDNLLNGKQVSYRSEFLPRIWTCVAYHWKKATEVDEAAKTAKESILVEDVLAGLTQRRSFDPKKRNLGGNPVPDMVYTVHYVKKNEGASRVMDTEYRKHCRGAVNSRSDMVQSFDEWWNTFMSELGGFEHERHEDHATIYRYSGRDHLKSWLGIAAINHARGHLRQGNKYTYPGEDKMATIAIDNETPEDLVILIENEADQERLLEAIPKALEKLSKKEKYVIQRYYYDGGTLEQIAKETAFCRP